MTDIFLHGIETIENTNGPRPVATIDTGVIGMVFTAPDADAGIWPLNTPVAVYGYSGFPSGLGVNGTGPDQFQAIFDQASRASQTIVAVRVEEGANDNATMANIIGNSLTKTGMHAFRNADSLIGLKPKILIAPGYTSARPTDGVASIAIDTPGTGFTEAPAITITGDGFGATAIATIDSTTGAITEIVITNPGGGYTTATVGIAGDGSGAAATATLGQVANPVAMELLTVARSLRACVIVDATNSTSTDAYNYRQDFDTDRLLILDPFVKVQDGESIVSQPASGRVAGLQAEIDYTKGFWHSPSNHVLQGVLGTSRIIEHSLSDPSAESQFLNKNEIAAIVKSPSGGFKLFGNRVPSSDSLKAFWSVRRAHDTMIESIELAHEPFLDKPFSVQAITEIAETVNAALRKWEALGATLGGRVWLDLSLNTAETWAAGQLYVSYDAEAPAPMEQITFIFNRNTGYYETLAADAVAEIARLASQN
jgi:phage tail sheath protein FI